MEQFDLFICDLSSRDRYRARFLPRRIIVTWAPSSPFQRALGLPNTRP
jgi:hypothetical protein